MEELGSDHLILLVILTRLTASMHSYALINSGGSAIRFMDTNVAAIHEFALKELEKPLMLNVVDKHVILSGSLTHYIKLPISISHHTEQCIFLLTKLGHYQVVLGIKSLQIHDVSTKWALNMAIFNSPYCKENYLPEE